MRKRATDRAPPGARFFVVRGPVPRLRGEGGQGDRLGAAGALAERFGAVVVLKGSGSVVASPEGALMLCPFGNGRLATAGTGDVLAGWLGGLWARQATAVADADTLPALASAAVAGHGLAAEQAPGRGPLLATDLIAAMQALG